MGLAVARIWINGELIQNLKRRKPARTKYRMPPRLPGSGSLSYPIRFRNLPDPRVAGQGKWQVLYDGPADLGKWFVSEGKPQFAALDQVLWADAPGIWPPRRSFADFELRMYVSAVKDHNAACYSGPRVRVGWAALRNSTTQCRRVAISTVRSIIQTVVYEIIERTCGIVRLFDIVV